MLSISRSVIAHLLLAVLGSSWLPTNLFGAQAETEKADTGAPQLELVVVTDFQREPNILVDPKELKGLLEVIRERGPDALQKNENWYVLKIHNRAGQVPLSVKFEGQRYALVAKSAVLAPRLDLSRYLKRAEADAIGERWGISVNMHESVGDAIAALTGPHFGFRAAIVVNGTVVLAPTIRGELRDRISISGAFSMDEAKAIAQDLQVVQDENHNEVPAPAIKPSSYSALAGEWTVREVIGLTVEDRRSPLPKKSTVLIRDNVIEVTNAPYRFERVSFMLDGERNIDMQQHRTGQSYFGIFQVKGKTLRIQLIDRTRAEAGVARPDSFEGDDNEAAFTVILQR